MASVSARAALRGIEKRYGGIRTLRGVNLNLDRREIHALVGQNGAGKSTLIKVLSGAVWPDAGVIVVDSEPRRSRSPAAAARASVNVVHQDVHVFPDLSVVNITVANAPRRRVGPIALRDRRAARRRAQRVLTRRSGPTARRRRSCSRRTRRR